MIRKLHVYIIGFLLLCLGFKSYSMAPPGVDVWNMPISFELMPVAWLDLPDAKLDRTSSTYQSYVFYNSKTIFKFANTADLAAPPCDYIGDTCDDNNPDTVNDRVGADCICRGEALAITCDDVTVTYQIDGGLIDAGTVINANETDSLELFANVQDYVVRDPNGVVVPNNKIVGITPEKAGDYTVTTTFPMATPGNVPITIVSKSSDMAGERVENVLDNKSATIWHTTWVAAALQTEPDPGYPHEVVLDMGAEVALKGFKYLPRQGVGEGTHGRIKGYQIYVSNVLGEWESTLPIIADEFSNTELLKIINFDISARYVRFVAMSPQDPTHPWASAAHLGVVRDTDITLHDVTSEEVDSFNNAGRNAVDGLIDTFWHTEWLNPSLPQSITLDMGVSSNITGLTYLPRATGSNGNITAFNVLVSETPDFESINIHHSDTWLNDDAAKSVTFPEIRGRYVRLVVTAGVNDFASASEISVIRPTINVACTKTIRINVLARKTYAYNNGVWSPAFPENGPLSNDVLIINQGDATFDVSYTVDKLIVNPGASAIINTTITTTTTTLKSQSNLYSSLIVNGAINGLIKYELWVNRIGTVAGGGNDLVSSPVRGVSFNNAFRLANLNVLPENPDPIKKGEFAFAPYNVESGAYENFNIGNTYNGIKPIVPGLGYRAATNAVNLQTGNTLTFTGSAETGSVSVSISDAELGKAWNLIGNPYPSYINVGDFLTVENLAAMDSRYGAIYGYKGNKNDWIIINRAQTEGLIAPGQGFFVKANTGGGSIQFTPAMQRIGEIDNFDDFIAGRSANSNKVLSKLKLTSGSNNVSTSIYFIEGSTKGLDPGYDAAAYGATQIDFLLFTNLLEDNTGLDFVIQSLPYNDFNNVIVPLGMKVKAGVELSISIDDLSTLPSNINVYLEDTQDETLTLLNDGDFKFTPTTALNGSGRFNVHYAAKTLSVEDLDANDNFRIYTTATPKTLFIKGKLSKVTTANLYDIQGRLVLSTILNPNTIENTMDISTLGTGIYVVKVNNDNQIKTQKIIIK